MLVLSTLADAIHVAELDCRDSNGFCEICAAPSCDSAFAPLVPEVCEPYLTATDPSDRARIERKALEKTFRIREPPA